MLCWITFVTFLSIGHAVSEMTMLSQMTQLNQRLTLQRCHSCQLPDVACPELKDTNIADCMESDYCIKFAPGSNFTYFNVQKNQYVSIVGGFRKCVDQPLMTQLGLMGVQSLGNECHRNQKIEARGITGRTLSFTGEFCLCNKDTCNGSKGLHSSIFLLSFGFLLLGMTGELGSRLSLKN